MISSCATFMLIHKNHLFSCRVFRVSRTASWPHKSLPEAPPTPHPAGCLPPLNTPLGEGVGGAPTAFPLFPSERSKPVTIGRCRNPPCFLLVPRMSYLTPTRTFLQPSGVGLKNEDLVKVKKCTSSSVSNETYRYHLITLSILRSPR